MNRDGLEKNSWGMRNSKGEGVQEISEGPTSPYRFVLNAGTLLPSILSSFPLNSILVNVYEWLLMMTP